MLCDFRYIGGTKSHPWRFEMPGFAKSLMLAAFWLLCGLLASTSIAQEAKKLAIDPKLIFQPDRRLDPTGAVVDPGASVSRNTVDLANVRKLLGDNVRLSQYDPVTNKVKDISAAAVANLKAGEYIAVGSDQIKLQPLKNAQGRVYSPNSTVLISKNADGSTSNLRVDDYSDGFAWKKDSEAFEARISVAVSDIDNPKSSASLATPISIKITGTALTEPPERIEISKLGFDGEKDVVMRSEGRSDPVVVTMRHAIDPNAPKKIDLPVSRPTLTLSANPPKIAAYGIEATEITIDSRGTLPAGLSLTLDSDSGTLDPKTVKIGDDGLAKTRLWSAGVGTTGLTVLDDRFRNTGTTVKFKKPLGFLIAVVLGAALGATFVYFWQRARTKGDASIWSWCAAFVFGIGVTIAAFAGFEIPKMLDLPQGRAGLIVPAATAFVAAVLTSTIYAAMSGAGGDSGAAQAT